MNLNEMNINGINNGNATEDAEQSRREFLGIGAATALVGGGQFIGSPLVATESDGKKAKMTPISIDSVADA